MSAPAGDPGTLSVTEVRALDLEALGDGARAAAAGGRTLRRAASKAGEAIDAALQDWSGAAADSAGTAVHVSAGQARSSARGELQLADTLSDYTGPLTAQRDAVLQAVTDAAAEGLIVDESTSSAAPRSGSSIDERRARVATRRIRQALRAFGVIDTDAAAAVETAAASAEAEGGAFGAVCRLDTSHLLAELPDDADPSRNREFWRSLSDDERTELIAVRPAAIGALDGIPADARHRANMNLLDHEQERLEAREHALQQQYARSPARFFAGIGTDTDEKLARTRKKLSDIAAIRDVVDEHPAARLVSLDMRSGDRGKAAVSVGDPDTADHISVTTPGDNTTIHGSLGEMADQAAALRDEAAAQIATTGDGPETPTTGAGPETVASIAWIGYAPPQTPTSLSDAVLEAATDAEALAEQLADTSTPDIARAGANDLAPFLDGLQTASVHPDPHITALGHSYGSLTTSLALQNAAVDGAVDDAVFYGSPGLLADGAGDVGLAEHHAYVLEADDDPVADIGVLNVLGPDPSSSDRFDQLSTDASVTPDGVHRTAAHGHSAYPRPDEDGDLRTAGYNMAAVVADRPRLLIRD